MMISSHDKEAYVWIWLPEETEPVVAGRLEADNGNILFNYSDIATLSVPTIKNSHCNLRAEITFKSGHIAPTRRLEYSGTIR
ncbi:MAG: hypothetical protein IPJ05_02985 [Nitrosomonas sp.]|nr:hypothetical protein [Nitrosomonas sp.]